MTTSTVAAKYNGQDLNGDGTPDYGSCIAKKVGGQSYWWLIDIVARLLQSQGTGQGAFFDTKTMDPLFNNDAVKLALQTYKKTGDYGPPDENNLDLGAIRSLFTTGRCALTLDWGDTGTLAPGTYVADKYASLVTARLDAGLGSAPRASSCPATRPPARTPSTASTTLPSPPSVAGRARSTPRPIRSSRTRPTRSCPT